MATSYQKPPPITLFPVRDFTGGYNCVAGPLQLREYECWDVRNIDFQLQGGLRQRRAVQSFLNYGAAGVSDLEEFATPLWEYTTPGGVPLLVGMTNNANFHVVGATGVATYVVSPDTLPASYARANVFGKSAEGTGDNILYIQRNAQQVALSYDGTTFLPLGIAYNEDIALPTSNNMPIARYIATFANHQFVACTYEDGVLFRDRLRYSHPGAGADFRALDFFDVDSGHNNDSIVGLVPFADRMLVFKQHSVYAVYGFDTDTFQVVLVSGSVGAMSQEAIVSTEFGVYFLSEDQGLMLYDGSALIPSSLRVWIDPAEVATSGGVANTSGARLSLRNLTNVHLGWFDRLLWIAGEVGTDVSVAFVLDTSLRHRWRINGRYVTDEGAWTIYSFANTYDIDGTHLGFNLASWATKIIGLSRWHSVNKDFIVTRNGLLRVDAIADQDTMIIGHLPSTCETHAMDIASYYVSSWYDNGNSAIIKRWKRPEFVVRTGLTGQLGLQVYHDYNPAEAKRLLSINTRGVGVVNSAVWDTAAWDVAVWAGDSEAGEAVVRVPILGRARAVQLKISGPTPSERWSIDAVNLKYVPRRLRG